MVNSLEEAESPGTQPEGTAPSGMEANALEAARFLKALAHQGRLMILCHLNEGEKTVSELEHLVSLPQAAVSQQLARLRTDGLVSFRREGKMIYYALTDGKTKRTIALLYELFCATDGPE